MARRRLFWHIGPDDLGTRFVAAALDARRDALAEQDVLVPGTPAAWELATAELRRGHRDAGFRRAEVDGQTATLVRRVWKHKGTSVLSTPGLAGATPEQVALALDGVRDVELHLVLVVRDAESRAGAAVQALLESGVTVPDGPAATLLDDPGRDVDSVRTRWARTVLPENVHVVEATEPDRIWAALTSLLGVDVDLPAGMATGQLDPERAAVLRDVVASLGDRIDPAGRRTAVRDLLVGSLLAGTGHRTAADALADALLEVARLQEVNAALSEENVRLDRKRRKHKRRAKELSRKAA